MQPLSRPSVTYEFEDCPRLPFPIAMDLIDISQDRDKETKLNKEYDVILKTRSETDRNVKCLGISEFRHLNLSFTSWTRFIGIAKVSDFATVYKVTKIDSSREKYLFQFGVDKGQIWFERVTLNCKFCP